MPRYVLFYNYNLPKGVTAGTLVTRGTYRDENKMSNELIEKKLNEIINKLLGMSKRIKKLEELDTATVGSIEDIDEKIKALEEQEEKFRAPITGAAWIPNRKFLSWYEGSFAASEDDVQETEEEDEEEIIEDTDKAGIDEEIIKKLDEVNDVIDDA